MGITCGQKGENPFRPKSLAIKGRLWYARGTSNSDVSSHAEPTRPTRARAHGDPRQGAPDEIKQSSMETRNFDLTFIVPASADDSDNAQEVVAGVKAMLETNGASIVWEDSLGKHKLSYPIKHQSYGHYFTFVYTAEGESATKIDHELRLNADVLRYLIVKQDAKTVEQLEQEKEEREQYTKRGEEKEAEEKAKRESRGGRGRRGGKEREKEKPKTGVNLEDVPVKKEKEQPQEEVPTEKTDEPVDPATPKTPEGEEPESEAKEQEEEKKEEKVELSDLDSDKLDEILDKEIDI